MRKKYPGLDHVGAMIKFYRKIANLTQEELAEKTGLDNSYISDLERGKCTVAAHHLISIAKALNIQPGDLFPDVRDLSV